jgi:hypothetical protein
MTLKQKFQNEIETESTASLNMGDVLSWGVLIFGEGHLLNTEVCPGGACPGQLRAGHCKLQNERLAVWARFLPFLD